MNRAVQFLGVLLIGFIIWAVVDYNGLQDAVRHYYSGPSTVMAQPAVVPLRAEAQASPAGPDARLIELEAQSVETRLGKSAAARYRMCHTSPPSTGREKEKCEQLDARFRAEETKRSKRPL